jgi:hypothetical protein
MALGIGVTRGFIGCLQTRYSLLGCPLIVCLYLIGAFYGPAIPPGRLRWACAAGLLLLGVLYNVKGLRLTSDMIRCVLRTEESVREGLPCNAVAARHWEDMQDFTSTSLAQHLEMMRGAGIGPYRGSNVRKATREVVVAPLVALAYPRTSLEMKALVDRAALAQSFVAANGWPLCRIDLEANPPRGAGGMLHWTIDEIDPGGQRRTRAHGDCPLNGWPDPGYALLTFEPFAAAPGTKLELRLHMEGTAAQLRVPRYRLSTDAAQGGLRAYAYYEKK